jgi:hypothetical protein
MRARSIFWAASVLGVLGLSSLAGCALVFPSVSPKMSTVPATPPVLASFQDSPAVTSARDWSENRVPVLKKAFEDNVYGVIPPAVPVSVVERKNITSQVNIAGATVEQWALAFGNETNAPKGNMILVVPNDGRAQHATLVMQNFCGNRAALPGAPLAASFITEPPKECYGQMSNMLIKAVLGEYANAPPWADLISRHYAVAMLYAGDVVPDDAVASEPALKALWALGGPQAATRQQTGALAAWAWAYSRMIDVLSLDPRLNPKQIAIWGHSRNGKAALLAAATDPRIALVISHQAGRGGSALTRNYVGEPMAKLLENYPFWFAPAFKSFVGREAEIPVDQHQLIAMIAPRPVLLGQGREDRWADPESAFRALKGASPAYALFGSEGLTQSEITTPDLGFMDQHLKP